MIQLFTHAEQVAAHLRDQLLRGRWQGQMPGVAKLEAELGVNHTTIGQALTLLEDQGLLVHQGEKRRRNIVLPKDEISSKMKIGILLFDPEDHSAPDVIELRHRLIERGFTVVIPNQTLTELGMNKNKIARLVRSTEVDCWVVESALHDVLTWFSEQDIPTFALYGRYDTNMKIAALTPDRSQSISELVNRLVDHGHRRIVMLTASGGRPRYFTQALERHGILIGDYNIPYLERSPDGLRRCLDGLFSITPPTALIIDEVHIFLATQHELTLRGIPIPERVSIACMDGSSYFKWYRPTIAHTHWEMKPVTRRIIAWATNVSRGKQDIKKTQSKSVFVDGGTIGPAAKNA